MRTETLTHPVTGDVIEVDVNGSLLTAIVLLSNADLTILDFCDEQVPTVVDTAELRTAKVFRPLSLAA